MPTIAIPPAHIRGTTLLYPVLGSPVTQVKAPMHFNALFSVTIDEEEPSDEELFGPFYEPALDAVAETITT